MKMLDTNLKFRYNTEIVNMLELVCLFIVVKIFEEEFCAGYFTANLQIMYLIWQNNPEKSSIVYRAERSSADIRNLSIKGVRNYGRKEELTYLCRP